MTILILNSSTPPSSPCALFLIQTTQHPDPHFATRLSLFHSHSTRSWYSGLQLRLHRSSNSKFYSNLELNVVSPDLLRPRGSCSIEVTAVYNGKRLRLGLPVAFPLAFIWTADQAPRRSVIHNRAAFLGPSNDKRFPAKSQSQIWKSPYLISCQRAGRRWSEAPGRIEQLIAIDGEL